MMLPEENAKANARFEEMHARSKKMRRRILIALVIIVAVVTLLLVAVFLIEKTFSEKNREIPQYDYEFYPVYEGNIMEDREYLDLNREITYCSDPSGYGLTQSITIENMHEFDNNVLFLYSYIQTIIDGNAEAYNACFNSTYFETTDPKGDFSQQMVYNARITFLSEEETADGGRNYSYRLEYMIHRNDGTFRRDVNSDAIRPQTVTVHVGLDGKPLIEKIVTHYIK